MESTARRWAAVYAERERLLRIARSRTLNEAEAEDCVSEAMLRCVEFEGLDEERLAAFLTTVTLRLCADQHRARARLLRAGGRIAEPAAEPGPEVDVCERAEAAWLAAHVRRLPVHQRRVVEARAAGLSCADVANRLEVSVDAVKSAVARARMTVRAALVSNVGLLPAIVGRYRVVAGVAGGAVAGAAVSGLLLVRPPDATSPAPAAPRVVAIQPPGRPQAVTPVRAATPARPAATSKAAPVRAVRRALPPPVAVVPAEAVPTPPPVAKAGPYEVARDPRHYEYTADERVLHCVTEGIQIDPYVQCRYPGGDPE